MLQGVSNGSQWEDKNVQNSTTMQGKVMMGVVRTFRFNDYILFIAPPWILLFFISLWDVELGSDHIWGGHWNLFTAV